MLLREMSLMSRPADGASRKSASGHFSLPLKPSLWEWLATLHRFHHFSVFGFQGCMMEYGAELGRRVVSIFLSRRLIKSSLK